MTDQSTRQHLIGRLPRLIGSGVDYNDAMGVIANMAEVADWSRGCARCARPSAMRWS